MKQENISNKKRRQSISKPKSKFQKLFKGRKLLFDRKIPDTKILYRLDKCNSDVIIAQRFPDTGPGKTINSNELFLQPIIQGNVRIKGIIATKAENKLIELTFNLKEF